MRTGIITCFVLIVILATCSGCGASWHLKRSKYHENKAIALGAKVTEDIDTTKKEGFIQPPEMVSKVDTVYVPGDTVVITQDNIVTKVVVKPGRKIYVHSVGKPPRVKYVQTIYITRNRKISAGFTNWQYYSGLAGVLLFGLIVGALLGRLLWK